MADWKTYAKAAQNTARKQAPGAKDAARRASGRAGAYVRAAERAIDEGRRPDDAPRRAERDRADDRRSQNHRDQEHRPEHHRPEDRRDQEHRDREHGTGGTRPTSSRTSTAPRPALDTDKLSRDAAAYYTVASRRVSRVNIIPRIMRALRDALLIGLSLFIIWGVLAAAGIPIPFTTVLIIVGVIVVVSFGAGLYAQWKRSRDAG